jgi:hypothetical protein
MPRSRAKASSEMVMTLFDRWTLSTENQAKLLES